MSVARTVLTTAAVLLTGAASAHAALPAHCTLSAPVEFGTGRAASGSITCRGQLASLAGPGAGVAQVTTATRFVPGLGPAGGVRGLADDATLRLAAVVPRLVEFAPQDAGMELGARLRVRRLAGGLLVTDGEARSEGRRMRVSGVGRLSRGLLTLDLVLGDR